MATLNTKSVRGIICTSIKIPGHLHSAIAMIAIDQKRSLMQQILWILEEYVKTHPRQS